MTQLIVALFSLIQRALPLNSHLLAVVALARVESGAVTHIRPPRAVSLSHSRGFGFH